MFAQSLRRGAASAAQRSRALTSASASASAAAASLTRRALSAVALRATAAAAASSGAARPVAARAAAVASASSCSGLRRRASMRATAAAPSLAQLRGLLHARFNSTAVPAAGAGAGAGAAKPAELVIDVTTPIATAPAAAAPFVDPAAAAAAAAASADVTTAAVATGTAVAAGAVLTDAAAVAVPWAWYQYPMVLAGEAINAMHAATGLPWWASIIATTVALRYALLPINIFQQKMSAKLSYMKPEMERWNKEYMQLHVLGKLNPETTAHMKNQMYAIQEKHGVRSGTGKMFATILVTMPMFMSMFFALRRPELFGTDFKTGGTAWFPDLSVTDRIPLTADFSMPLLPVLSAATMAASVKWGSDTGGTQQKKGMQYFLYSMCGVSVLFASNFPAGVCVYWLTANVVSVVNGWILRRPPVRKLLGIPPLYVEPKVEPKRAVYSAVSFANTPLPPDSMVAKEQAEKALKAKVAPVVPLVRSTHRPVRHATATVESGDAAKKDA